MDMTNLTMVTVTSGSTVVMALTEVTRTAINQCKSSKATTESRPLLTMAQECDTYTESVKNLTQLKVVASSLANTQPHTEMRKRLPTSMRSL